jgi:hypothetical protein
MQDEKRDRKGTKKQDDKLKAVEESESGNKLREVMTDNALEALSMGEERDFCERDGPVSSCVAESAIWVRDSGLPDSLWAEAFNTSMYVHNRTPTRVLGGRAPFEVQYGTITCARSERHAPSSSPWRS